MKKNITCYINGEFTEINSQEVFKPLHKFLRENLYLTGTKEACGEGDCGACTILLGKARNGKILYKPVNSCIVYVYQIDNCHIITIEGLKYGEKLNPVQDSIIKNHGTQCGYCTPGFVNSLYSYFNNLSGSEKIKEKQIKKALTGNLCRCTGYEGIISSALDVNPCEVKKLDELYPPENLEKILDEQIEKIEISNEKQKYIKPVSLREVLECKSKNPNARIIAGGTDIHILTNKKNVIFEELIDISDIKELKNISVQNDCISIGAAVTVAEAENTFKDYFPEFYNLLEYYASPQIKNIATIIGNITNASPVGDSIPFLMAMNSSLEICGTAAKRELNINHLFKGYKTLDLSSDEIITGVKIPLLKENEIIKLYKVSKRKHLDISAFSAAFKIKLENNVIVDFVMVLGGVAAYTVRMSKVEEFVKGKEFTENLFISARTIIEEEISPLSDVRGSKEYRINLAGNIIIKFYNELSKIKDEKCLY